MKDALHKDSNIQVTINIKFARKNKTSAFVLGFDRIVGTIYKHIRR